MTAAPRLSGMSPIMLGATGVAQVAEWRDPCATVLARHAKIKDIHQKAERLAVAALPDAFDHLPTFAHVIRTYLSLSPALWFATAYWRRNRSRRALAARCDRPRSPSCHADSPSGV